MRKLFTSIACALLLGASSLPAAAQIQLETPFQLTGGQDTPFTAPETGTLTATIDPGLFSFTGDFESILFTNTTHSDVVPMQVLKKSGDYYAIEVSWEVTADVTYYFYNESTTTGPWDITLYMGEGGAPAPESTLKLNESISFTLGEYETFISEVPGVLTAKLSPSQANTTEAASIVSTLWDKAENILGENGLVAFTTNIQNSRYSEQYYEIKANMLYYISTNDIFGNISAIFSFKTEEADNATPLSWDVATTLLFGTEYYIIGNGEPSHIEANKDDLNVGGQLYISNADTQEAVTLMPMGSESGKYLYNIGTLEEGVRYNVSIQVDDVSVTFMAGEVEAEEVAPTNISLGTYDLLANTVYCFTATEDSVLVITTEQCDPSEVAGSIIFTDPTHQTALEDVNAGVDDDDSYMCSFPVKKDIPYYIYFTSPNYIVATLAYQEEVDIQTYMALPTLAYEADEMMPALLIYWEESIKAIDEDADLEGTLTTPEGEVINVKFTITTWAGEEEGEPSTGETDSETVQDNALILNMTSIYEEYGIGEYHISLASIVMNENGDWNLPVDEDFEVTLPVSGISSIESAPSAGETIYDLQGRKVNKAGKGLYIINGKKVIVK